MYYQLWLQQLALAQRHFSNIRYHCRPVLTWLHVMFHYQANDTALLAALQALQAVPAVPDATLEDILMLVLPANLYM